MLAMPNLATHPGYHRPAGTRPPVGTLPPLPIAGLSLAPASESRGRHGIPTTSCLSVLLCRTATYSSCHDPHLANGKKLLAETKELRAFYAALEAIRKFPRLKRALSKALHPNAHFSEAGGAEEQRALTEIFQQLAAVFDRIEGRQ